MKTLVIIASLVLTGSAARAEPAAPPSLRSRPLLNIAFSLNDKPVNRDGHVVILYVLHGSGEAYNVRDVFNWARQAMHRLQLDADAIVKVMALAKALPEREGGDIARDKLVAVRVRHEDETKTLRYSRDALPPAMKDILLLLGGTRHELLDSICFTGEEKKAEELFTDKN